MSQQLDSNEIPLNGRTLKDLVFILRLILLFLRNPIRHQYLRVPLTKEEHRSRTWEFLRKKKKKISQVRRPPTWKRYQVWKWLQHWEVLHLQTESRFRSGKRLGVKDQRWSEIFYLKIRCLWPSTGVPVRVSVEIKWWKSLRKEKIGDFKDINDNNSNRNVYSHLFY